LVSVALLECAYPLPCSQGAAGTTALASSRQAVATDVRVGGTTLSDRILVAAGGGGEGGFGGNDKSPGGVGGAGGRVTGGNGNGPGGPCDGSGGYGGTQTAGGD
jgi:hypothetical protein